MPDTLSPKQKIVIDQPYVVVMQTSNELRMWSEMKIRKLKQSIFLVVAPFHDSARNNHRNKKGEINAILLLPRMKTGLEQYIRDGNSTKPVILTLGMIKGKSFKVTSKL